MFEFFKKSMTNEFEMTDLGLMRYFLGVEVTQTHTGNFIGQKKYAQQLIERFKLDEYTFGTPSELGLKLHKHIEGLEVDNGYFKQITTFSIFRNVSTSLPSTFCSFLLFRTMVIF